jgi:hypothetical protein
MRWLAVLIVILGLGTLVFLMMSRGGLREMRAGRERGSAVRRFGRRKGEPPPRVALRRAEAEPALA